MEHAVALAEGLVYRGLYVALGNMNLNRLFNRAPRFHRISLLKFKHQFVVLALDLNGHIVHWHPEVALIAQLLVPLDHDLRVAVFKVPQGQG